MTNENLEKFIVELHKAIGYPDCRCFTKEEKEKMGIDTDTLCGTLGTFGLDNLPLFIDHGIECFFLNFNL